MMLRFNERYRREITAKLVAALKNGTAPWQRPWTDEYMPVNAITGRPYSGMNSIILSIEGDRLSNNGDTRWITANQAGKKGWLVKAGAKPVTIFSIFISQDDAEIDRPGRPCRRIIELYHASQIEGISVLRKRKDKRGIIVNNMLIDKIRFNSNARVFEGGNEAFYSLSDDIIRIPCKESFSDTESYYSTLLHELVHWTGYHTRLNRRMLNSNNSEAYAREELIAEIASVYLTAELGVTQTQEHFAQHAAYLSYWIKMLESNPNEFFAAVKEANKAVRFILDFEEHEAKLAG